MPKHFGLDLNKAIKALPALGNTRHCTVTVYKNITYYHRLTYGIQGTD